MQSSKTTLAVALIRSKFSCKQVSTLSVSLCPSLSLCRSLCLSLFVSLSLSLLVCCSIILFPMSFRSSCCGCSYTCTDGVNEMWSEHQTSYSWAYQSASITRLISSTAGISNACACSCCFGCFGCSVLGGFAYCTCACRLLTTVCFVCVVYMCRCSVVSARRDAQQRLHNTAKSLNCWYVFPVSLSLDLRLCRCLLLCLCVYLHCSCVSIGYCAVSCPCAASSAHQTFMTLKLIAASASAYP